MKSRFMLVSLSFALLAAQLHGQTTAPSGKDAPAPKRPAYVANSCAGDFREPIEAISRVEGYDLCPYLEKVIRITQASWTQQIASDTKLETLKSGEVTVALTILPNGRLQPHTMLLLGRSGFVSFDRASWRAIETSGYPPMPEEFPGRSLKLQFRFRYNPDASAAASPAPSAPAVLPSPQTITLTFTGKS
jgi:hypothetical protein